MQLEVMGCKGFLTRGSHYETPMSSRDTITNCASCKPVRRLSDGIKSFLVIIQLISAVIHTIFQFAIL